MTVAYQGVEGAFAHEACLAFLPRHVPIGLATFGEVVAAVEENRTEFGMLPLANNEAGETGARELIGKARLHVVAEPFLAVRMHLLGLRFASLDRIRTIVSHPVALRQCARSLAALGLPTEETSNTALAAKTLTNPRRAVLASERAAVLYGLAILKRDMHDRSDNRTKFAIVARSRP